MQREEVEAVLSKEFGITIRVYAPGDHEHRYAKRVCYISAGLHVRFASLLGCGTLDWGGWDHTLMNQRFVELVTRHAQFVRDADHCDLMVCSDRA